MKPTTCEPTMIDRLLAGELSDAEETALVQHLDQCDHCCAAMNERSVEQDVWKEAQRFLSGLARADSSTTSPHSLGFLAPSDDPRMLGRFGQYEILGVIGSGGMGVVLKGDDTALNRYVAIKVLAPQLATVALARKRFAREAQAAAAVVHDNVIPIFGVDEFNDLPYLVMPYVGGMSLQKRIDNEGPLSVAEVLRIAAQTAAGLAAAHKQGLVHRDIKPANLLLPSNVERVQITDFGLARAADDRSLTKIGVIAGTPEYMSPEQARGEHVDYRSDLFSLGSVMYAMCTGTPPFRAGTSYGVLQKISDDVPKPIREQFPAVPQWLECIIEKLHAKSPEDRFQSAEETARVLNQCLAHLQNMDEPLPDGVVEELQACPVAEVAKTSADRAANTELLSSPATSRGGRRRWFTVLVCLALFGAISAGVIVAIKKDGKTVATVNAPEGSNITIEQTGGVTVNLPSESPKDPTDEDMNDNIGNPSGKSGFSITPSDELAIAQLKTECDQLIAAFEANDAGAIEEVRKRFRQHVEGKDQNAAQELTQQQAELVIARAHGFDSWERLQQEVRGLTADAMCEAAAAGHVKRVRKLAEERPDLVNMARRGNFGQMTPMHFAVINGRVEVVRVLMELRANARSTVYPIRGDTYPLQLARMRGATKMVEIIEHYEHKRKTEEKLADPSGVDDLAELIAAIREEQPAEAIQMLESSPELKTSRDDERSLPLHVAAGSHNIEVLKWLLARDPQLEAKDNKGRTPMDRAAISGHHGDEKRHARFRETVKLLLEHDAKLTSRAAVATNHQEALKKMHAAGDLEQPLGIYGGGLLELAIISGNVNAVPLLLDLGLDADELYSEPDAGGDARSWGFPLVAAIEHDEYETFMLLLDQGADPSARIYASGTPIMSALGKEDDRYLDELLRRGAKLNLYEISRRGRVDLVKAVLAGEATGKIDAEEENLSPAQCADGMLCGAIDGGQVEVLRLCVPHLNDPPGGGLMQRTWWRAEKVETLEVLLSGKSNNPNSVGRFGEVALHDLAKTKLEPEEKRLQFLELMLDAGAEFTTRDIFFESTPLGWACRYGRLEMVKRLVEAGAPVNEPDAPAWATPLHWAETRGHQEVAEFLRSNGAKQ